MVLSPSDWEPLEGTNVPMASSTTPVTWSKSQFFLTLFPDNHSPEALWLSPRREEPGLGSDK